MMANEKAKQPCKTCGGSREVDDKFRPIEDIPSVFGLRLTDATTKKPCPDCQQSSELPIGVLDQIVRMQETIDQLQAENKRLNKVFERWQHMIDPDTDPGGCANCFHQEWKENKQMNQESSDQPHFEMV